MSDVLFLPGKFTWSPYCESWAKAFEELELKAYSDGDGVACGYGHNSLSGLKPIPKIGDVWTEEQADAALAADLTEQAHYVNAYVRVPLAQYQIDALILHCFQRGPSCFAKSSAFFKHLISGDFASVANDLLMWPTALKGLARRYKVESEIFQGLNPSPTTW